MFEIGKYSFPLQFQTRVTLKMDQGNVVVVAAFFPVCMDIGRKFENSFLACVVAVVF